MQFLRQPCSNWNSLSRSLQRRLFFPCASRPFLCASKCAKSSSNDLFPSCYKPPVSSAGTPQQIGARKSTAAPETLGSALQQAGFSTSNISTPSFGDISSIAPPPDMEIDAAPAVDVDYVRDLHGPWIMIADGAPHFQGELFLDNDGFAYFRPGAGLGHGIGRVVTSKTSAGFTTFRIDLELYLYTQTTRVMPKKPDRYSLVGVVMKAVSAKEAYETHTLAGYVFKINSSGMIFTQEKVGELNAAKMTPWDAASYTRWSPDARIHEGFHAMFPTKCSLSRLEQHKQLLAVEAQKATPMPLNEVMNLASSTRTSFFEQFSKSTLLGNDEATNKYKLDVKIEGESEPVKNLYYVPDYISKEDEANIEQQLQHTPKELKQQLEKRVVQEYGCAMCDVCKMSFVPDTNRPPWTSAICDALVSDGVFDPATFPNSVRIHEYQPDHGIAPHTDGPIYVPTVAILSVSHPILFHFYKRRPMHEDALEHYKDTFKFDDDKGLLKSEKPAFSVICEPRSLLVFDSDVYYYFPHGFGDNPRQSLDPAKCGPIINRHLVTQVPHDATEIVRQPRSSVTVRNLLSRCTHQPTRTEYCMKQA